MYFKETLIISAYPACGKTYLSNDAKYNSFSILDSDSSKYSHIINEDGNKVKNPDWPRNYIEYIKNNIGKVDIICVSSHLEVRQMMNDEGIRYYTVYPISAEFIRDEWLGRMFVRGNDINFLNFQKEHFFEFTENIKNEPHGIDVCFLDTGDHLSDFVDLVIRDYVSFDKVRDIKKI